MHKLINLFLVTFLASNFYCHAQHSVLLLNGREHPLRAYDLKGEYLIYSKPTDKNGRTHKMYLDRIYSVRDSILGERIVYAPDTTDSLELNKEEMRIFIDGEQYAMKHYKKPMNGITGAAIGAGAAFLSIYGLVIPFGYAAIIGSHNPKVPQGLPDAPPNINHDLFIDGYQYKAKKTKTKNAMIFGGIGFAASFTVLTILK